MMKILAVGCAVGLLSLGSASQARAELIYNSGITVTGTGLGSVYSVVTVQDSANGANAGDPTIIEGGCITNTGAFSPCLGEVTEHDNLTGAGNNVWTFDSTLSSFAAVVNISETGHDKSATLTGLYLNFCSTINPTQCVLAEYLGLNKVLNSTEGTGLGGSGWVFSLSPAEYAQVLALPGDLVTVAGGLQFAGGTTDDGNETLFVTLIPGSTPAPVPEPASLTLFGLGLSSVGYFIRRRKAA